MKLLLVFALLVAAGCFPGYQDVRDYGEERFIHDVLAATVGPPPAGLVEAFKPIRIEAHLNGAWLVLDESDGYQQGIYVDRESVKGLGGSGMEISPWSKQIGWSKEKIRTRVERRGGRGLPDNGQR